MKTSCLDQLGDRKAPKGSLAWAIARADEVRLEFGRTEKTIRTIQLQLRELHESGGWKELTDHDGYAYMSWEQFVESDWLRIPGHIAQAILAEEDPTKTIAELRSWGGDRKSEAAGEDQGSHRTLKRGETTNYLLARMQRDRPDLIERLEAGEFKSVRAAAIEAGIVKVPSGLERLKKDWEKASEADRREFLEWLGVNNQSSARRDDGGSEAGNGQADITEQEDTK